ncbi:MAG: ankyrin repeat domain-containing protein [Janthinobacterium lividum]
MQAYRLANKPAASLQQAAPGSGGATPRRRIVPFGPPQHPHAGQSTLFSSAALHQMEQAFRAERAQQDNTQNISRVRNADLPKPLSPSTTLDDDQARAVRYKAGNLLRGKNFDPVKFANLVAPLNTAQRNGVDSTGRTLLSTAIITGNDVALTLLGDADYEALNRDGSSASLLQKGKLANGPRFEQEIREEPAARQLSLFETNFASMFDDDVIKGNKPLDQDPDYQALYYRETPGERMGSLMMGAKGCVNGGAPLEGFNQKLSKFPGEYKDKKISPLQMEAIHANPAEVRTLIALGANLNLQEPFKKRTAMHLLCQEISPGNEDNALESLQALIDSGADAGIKDSNGRQALHLLAKCTAMEVNERIPDPAKPGKTKVIWHRGKEIRSASMIEALANSGVDVNARDEAGNTPLFYAAATANVAAYDALIKAGADSNLRNRKNNTAEFVLKENQAHFASTYPRDHV